MHVLRSVCPNGSQKQTHLACLTPNPKWVICLLPAKQKFYWYFTYVSYISRAGGTLQYAILPIFVLRSYSNPSRAFIHTTSRLFMRAKCTYTGIPSRNPISSILNPYNFFWLETFQPNFGISLRYMYIISFCESLLRNCTATKKSIFYEHGLLSIINAYRL